MIPPAKPRPRLVARPSLRSVDERFVRSSQCSVFGPFEVRTQLFPCLLPCHRAHLTRSRRRTTPPLRSLKAPRARRHRRFGLLLRSWLTNLTALLLQHRQRKPTNTRHAATCQSQSVLAARMYLRRSRRLRCNWYVIITASRLVLLHDPRSDVGRRGIAPNSSLCSHGRVRIKTDHVVETSF